ncbi:low-specificity L-threonine aldolase [Caloranaerobacter azorensis]|uniref:Low-specificity L-threonine aldolase n=1 Tax=Caloranaerobacter azorensis TaxID=116090 RepID=A0A6P1YEE5_9FIRM|nr:low-specificity L-threonine aldolase [Caloranaerobacter azorensis]QIB26505.1 low-specificity L-threonine aldolase [Caloranaerobacter azorensis]
MKIIDFRSDTITKPTEEMRKAMYLAEVGDDVYEEDPTVKKLEEIGANLVGKEDALFVPSGTMGNQLALLAHTERGQEIILEEKSHIFMFEVGGLAFISGLQSKTIKGHKGIMCASDIERAIRVNNIHFPQTGLICLENTHNMAGGVITPIELMRKVYEIGLNYKIPIHLDGARVFNAAVGLGVDVKEITKYSDSVMFCLSKGLCAPVGSLLAGDKKFIEKARKYRKMLGGGMRQAGIIAAAGIVALENMIDRLEEDHYNNRLLAEKLININGIQIDMDTVQTNILMIDIVNKNYNADTVISLLKENGIYVSKISDYKIRFVTHMYISKEDILYTAKIMKDILE